VAKDGSGVAREDAPEVSGVGLEDGSPRRICRIELNQCGGEMQLDKSSVPEAGFAAVIGCGAASLGH